MKTGSLAEVERILPPNAFKQFYKKGWWRVMLTINDIRGYRRSWDMADDNVYIGKMDNKKQKSIGV